MYWRDTYRLRNTIEYEYKWAGNYGAGGETRAKKRKATPEQVKKQNQLNKEKKMRRLIMANFEEGDYWCTLKYTKGTRKETEEVKKDLKKFIETLRRNYRKYDTTFKFIYRIEIGKQGGIHIHMVLPRIRGQDTDKLIQKAWKNGRVNFATLDSGPYDALAEYITKPPDSESMKQMSFIPQEDRSNYIKYSTSRNLVRPVPERKVYSRRTVRRLLRDGPKPTPGYYIDKNSIVQGINQFTGMSYLHYREIREVNNRNG